MHSDQPWPIRRHVAALRRRRAMAGPVAVIAVLGLAAAGCGGDTEETGGGADATSSTASARELTVTTSSSAPAPPTSPSTTAAPSTAPPTTSAPAAAVAVLAVIDGDTIDVAGGERVRLIGIDTPEVGQCGYGDAAGVLRQLVGGRAVTLVPGASDDRDRYGRLLRYVEAEGVDVNLLMLLSGRAIARYDSRDGYGRHAREAAYVAADLANPSANVCGAVAPPSTLLSGTSGGTDPRFGSCREAIANGYGPYVAGRDPEYDWYRDGDGDGVNCE